MRVLFITICWVIIVMVNVNAQRQDSTKILPFDEFYALVISNHPIVKQASLLPQTAAQQLRLARGSFDPKLEGNWDYKNFKGTDYYNKANIGLKIPTWFPIDPKIGIEQNSGEFLNEESFISDATNNQQVFAGISVPIGRGLFIDQRRTMMRQAHLMQDMAVADQVKTINKILLVATKDYWEWYFAYENYQLIQQSIDIAQDIFDRTLLGYNYGETAAIDTVQARIALQSRMIDFQQANIARIKAALQLSNHLWTEEGIPLEIVDTARPEQSEEIIIDDDDLRQLTNLARDNHPELVKLGLKNQSLMVDRKLAQENLKPRIDVDYTILDQPIQPNGESTVIGLSNNYKVGVAFEFPLFLRKERAKLNQVKLKVAENNFQRSYKEREIINDIIARYNAVLVTGNILLQQQSMVVNYQRILAAERLNLANGESDLFKINVQFEKLLNSQTKLLKLRGEYQKNIASLYWAAGVTNLGFDGL